VPVPGWSDGLKKNRIFIIGGARSGKSSYGVALAMKLGKRVAYIATAEPPELRDDEEMKRRIQRHRAHRPKGVTTIEEPIDLSGALKGAQKNHDCIVIDCLTLWLSNLLGRGGAGWRKKTTEFLKTIRSMKKQVVIISNEVGMGVVPANRGARNFRDIIGGLNQAVASESDKVIMMVSGIPVVIKGK